MVYNETGATYQSIASNLIIYRMGKLRILNARGCKTNTSAIAYQLDAGDRPQFNVQFAEFCYLSGTYYTGVGKVIGENGVIELLRFTPSNVGVIDANVFHYFSASWCIT